MIKRRIRLGVNIDHIATIKTNRRTSYPSLKEAVTVVEKSGADLITVHLREDRRHIQDEDLKDIKATARKLNLEMALTNEMLNICLSIKPDYCCIVPEKREELTTEGGLDIKNMSVEKFSFLKKAINSIEKNDTQVSLFIDPDLEQIDYSKKSGAKVIELHTGSYADATNEDEKIHELGRIKNAAEYAFHKDMQVHAGHGLNLSNLSNICRISQIEELNIGHSVVADSIFKGLSKAVEDFRSKIDD